MHWSLSAVREARFVVACFLTVVSTFLIPTAASSAPPALSHLFPPGGQRGSKVTVTCTGTFSSWPVMVWAPGIDVVPIQESGKLEVSIPQDLATDRVWIRLYNAEGSSTAVPFLIGSLKEVGEQEPNNALRTAQALADPSVTINGVLQDGGDVDGFAVSLVAGQTLVAALDANGRLGSPMDAILQVTSAEGIVLAENHDGIGLDPRLALTAPKSGKYVVRLFAFPAAPDTTIAFRGAANYIYRLTLTTGPFVTHTVPASVPQTEPGTVEVFGWNIPPNTRIPVLPLGGTRLTEHQEFEMPGDLRNSPDARLGFAFSPEFPGASRIRLVPHAVVSTIAQSSPDDPFTLAPPTAVTGWLKIPRQTDVFRLPLKKGQQVVIAVESRSLELPLHPVVKLSDPTGAVTATVEAPEPQDAVIAHNVAQDGEYRLTVSDRYRQGGERCLYRLSVRIEEPSFELTANAEAIVVMPGKPVELACTVQRRMAPDGSIGPITIEAVDLPPGVTAPAVISEPTGPTATKVTLNFSTTGATFSGPIRIVGKAKAPQDIHRLVRTPPRFGIGLETIWLTAIGKP